MVGLRILVLWILPALCLSAGPVLSTDLMKNYLVHTYEKLGHRYMIEIDNDKAHGNDPDNFIYKAIGVAMYNTDKYSYTAFDPKADEQPIIYPFSGAATAGNDAFQLVHTDFKNIVRVNYVLHKKTPNKHPCDDPIKHGSNYAMLYTKKTRGDKFTDQTGQLVQYNGPNVKHIGTYFEELDLYKYVDENGEVVEVNDIDQLRKKGDRLPDRFELLCRVEHGYMKNKNK